MITLNVLILCTFIISASCQDLRYSRHRYYGPTGKTFSQFNMDDLALALGIRGFWQLDDLVNLQNIRPYEENFEIPSVKLNGKLGDRVAQKLDAYFKKHPNLIREESSKLESFEVFSIFLTETVEEFLMNDLLKYDQLKIYQQSPFELKFENGTISTGFPDFALSLKESDSRKVSPLVVEVRRYRDAYYGLKQCFLYLKAASEALGNQMPVFGISTDGIESYLVVYKPNPEALEGKNYQIFNLAKFAYDQSIFDLYKGESNNDKKREAKWLKASKPLLSTIYSIVHKIYTDYEKY